MKAKVKMCILTACLSSFFITGCAETQLKDVKPELVTESEFMQLKKGMTYEEVVDIIGGEGKPFNKESDSTISTYAWDGKAKGSFLTITFRNGKINSIMQNGIQLKMGD